MQISQNQNQTIPLEKEDINVIDKKNTNPLEKIEINKTDKNFFNHVPFSAPIKSNKNENFKKGIFFFFFFFNIWVINVSKLIYLIFCS